MIDDDKRNIFGCRQIGAAGLWFDPARGGGEAEEDLLVGLERLAATRRLLFLDVDGKDECCCFQNLPERRSVPTMAHAHVFLRSSSALAKLRAERRLRSPWAEAERLGGRGAEVG